MTLNRSKEQCLETMPSGLSNNTGSFPKVSVINVICGNNVKFIGNCLNSLINNTDYPDVEFIIVADAGDDMKNYIANIAKLNPAMKIVYRTNRHSNASNRNTGALYASPEAKYYLFSDSDVMYSNNQWLKNQVRILEANEDIGVLGGGEGSVLGHYCYINDAVGVVINFVHDFAEEIPTEPVEMMILPGYNMLMRRELFAAVRGWDEGFTPVYGEDIDICLRCILAGSRVYGMYNKGVHHLYRDSKENNSSELLSSDTMQIFLNLASTRRLALKFEGVLPTSKPGSRQEWLVRIRNMREQRIELLQRIKELPPTVVDGKINHLYLPLTNTEEISHIYDMISFSRH